ncbi:MAG TPA: hypothetical protein VGN56_02205 [Candidatus Paceibacterota bacterium]|jgi:hypothetical protein|nr:hypothetical protein [Candidatus Paceibacterota bacterium]
MSSFFKCTVFKAELYHPDRPNEIKYFIEERLGSDDPAQVRRWVGNTPRLLVEGLFERGHDPSIKHRTPAGENDPIIGDTFEYCFSHDYVVVRENGFMPGLQMPLDEDERHAFWDEYCSKFPAPEKSDKRAKESAG